MKKLLALCLLFICCYEFGVAQNCEPDSLYKDSTAGVYPGPITPTNPNGGIDTFACIGQPFEFVFTVIIPDTFSFNGLQLTLVSAFIETEGAIAGLPEGIDYACDPPNCVFQADSIGCFVLTGTPTPANNPGNYKPVITMTINTNIFPITTTFPGTIFPGEYILEVRDENCMLTSISAFELPDEWSSYPNPVSDEWTVRFNAPQNETHQLTITDVAGKVIMQQKWAGAGEQLLQVPVHGLMPGLYLYHMQTGAKQVAGRLLVERN